MHHLFEKIINLSCMNYMTWIILSKELCTFYFHCNKAQIKYFKRENVTYMKAPREMHYPCRCFSEKKSETEDNLIMLSNT